MGYVELSGERSVSFCLANARTRAMMSSDIFWSAAEAAGAALSDLLLCTKPLDGIKPPWTWRSVISVRLGGLSKSVMCFCFYLKIEMNMLDAFPMHPNTPDTCRTHPARTPTSQHIPNASRTHPRIKNTFRTNARPALPEPTWDDMGRPGTSWIKLERHVASQTYASLSNKQCSCRVG